MSSGFTELRRIEKTYTDNMPSEVDVLRRLRDTGKQVVGQSAGGASARKLGEGLALLNESVDGLRATTRDTIYQRELYASLYMLARGYCFAGNIIGAQRAAMEAMEVEPRIPANAGLPPELIADQYVAIASAPLSATLQSGVDGIGPVCLMSTPEAQWAKMAAKNARQTCRWSEDRTRMLFADGAMSDEQRVAARKNHIQKAAMVTGMLLLPTQSQRIGKARLLCKM